MDYEQKIKEAAKEHFAHGWEGSLIDAFTQGALWAYAHLWKSADGDELPEIDREVIVLTQPYPLKENEYVVSFAHRPNPNGWDGKNILTGEVDHYTPKTYDNGGWNIPDVKYWLDAPIPQEGGEE